MFTSASGWGTPGFAQRCVALGCCCFKIHVCVDPEGFPLILLEIEAAHESGFTLVSETHPGVVHGAVITL